MRCTPLTFLLTGFAWLLLASLLGIATMVGLVQGTPLPAWLKSIHVHGAFVGGLLQLVIGSLLVSMGRSTEQKVAYSQSRPALFFALNGITIALLIALWLGEMTLAGIAGVILLGAILKLATQAWHHVRKDLNGPSGVSWVYRGALMALFSGIIIGVSMAFRLYPEYYAHLRLLHIHLIVLGFFTSIFLIGSHQILPAVLQRELVPLPLADIMLWAIPVGFATLLGGFVTSSLKFELAIGVLLLIGVSICTYRLLKTWIRSDVSGSAASDHLLIGIFFLMLATATGIAIGANYLPAQPMFPIGSLHVVAYTHLAFVGFMVQSVCGALSYALPTILAANRVQHHKKRGPYREELDAIMNRWRTVQLGAMSLGAMALTVLAAFVWSFPLNSLYVQCAVWIAAGLLLASLTLFTAKLAWAIGLQPAP